MIWLCLFYINTLLLPSDSITCNHQFFDVTPMGHIYIVNGSQIKKINSKGKILCSYSNNSYGNIASVDSSHPLKLLVYYPDFNQIIFLDRYLSPIGSAIDLYAYFNDEDNLICSSQKGGIWCYNATNHQAVHINSEGNITTKSILLSGFFSSTPISDIAEYNNQLYLLYRNKGVVILNQEGQLLQKVAIPNIQSIQYHQNQFYFSDNKGGLFLYHLQLGSSKKIWQAQQPTKQIKLMGNRIYYSNGNNIVIEEI